MQNELYMLLPLMPARGIFSPRYAFKSPSIKAAHSISFQQPAASARAQLGSNVDDIFAWDLEHIGDGLVEGILERL